MYIYIAKKVASFQGLGNYIKFLIHFEVWAKLPQKWLVCAPLGIHLEPINKEVIGSRCDNIIIISCANCPKRELWSAKEEAQWCII